MTPPTKTNVTELLGGLSPALLYQLSVGACIPEEALQIEIPRRPADAKRKHQLARAVRAIGQPATESPAQGGGVRVDTCGVPLTPAHGGDQHG